MKRSLALLAAAALVLGACEPEPQVVVELTVPQPGATQAEPIADLPVRLLPYDRDALFDSLAAALRQPEPVVPQELLQRLDSLERTPPPAAPPGDSLARLRARQHGRQREQLAAQLDSLRTARRDWAQRMAQAFAQAVTERARATGRVEAVDTTDARGVARLPAPEDGRWWVFARYALPDHELYWNLPLESVGDSIRIRLTRENAQVRPLM